MEFEKRVEKAKENIEKALDDYGRYTRDQTVLEDITRDFIDRLAYDSTKAKQNLRSLFSQSPVWDEELDALVINGTRTSDPNYGTVGELAKKIMRPAVENGKIQVREWLAISNFFEFPNDEESQKLGIETINRIAPGSYKPNKKRSRVFKSLCQVIGVAEEMAGSTFQKQYALFADELSARKIDFKLFVSINPAHFLTMSNPKEDARGSMLTSCHSLNSTQYGYNIGCTGYARDETSFIVFTVADPVDRETLNNRKTSRQIFAYEAGQGILLQSRFYNTYGGTRGSIEESALYRDLIQREISSLEGKPNLWKTYPLHRSSEKEDMVEIGDGFGGYADWHYADFGARISIRNDCQDNNHSITVGTYGICVECACETADGAYCDDCKPVDTTRCEWCEDHFVEDDLLPVHDTRGHEIYVCEHCRDEYFRYCESCGHWFHQGDTYYVNDAGGYYCRDCADEYCSICENCGELYLTENGNDAIDGRGDINICDSCAEDFKRCEKCEALVSDDLEYCPNCGHRMIQDEEEE